MINIKEASKLKNFKTTIHSSEHEDNYIKGSTIFKVHEEHYMMRIMLKRATIKDDRHKDRFSPIFPSSIISTTEKEKELTLLTIMRAKKVSKANHEEPEGRIP